MTPAEAAVCAVVLDSIEDALRRGVPWPAAVAEAEATLDGLPNSAQARDLVVSLADAHVLHPLAFVADTRAWLRWKAAQ